MERTKVKITIRNAETGNIDFCGYVAKDIALKGIEELFEFDNYKKYILTFHRE